MKGKHDPQFATKAKKAADAAIEVIRSKITPAQRQEFDLVLALGNAKNASRQQRDRMTELIAHYSDLHFHDLLVAVRETSPGFLPEP